MYLFKLPDLGEGIAEAEVVKWLVREGEAVREDQPLAEVMTDKAVVEIPSPRAGRVLRLCGQEGEIIAVGQVLVEIDDGTGTALAPKEEDLPRAPAVRQSNASLGGKPSLRPPAEAVPAVRELAKQLGVEIDQVPGTGPGGRVMRGDVEAFYEGMKKGRVRAAPEEPPPDEADWTRAPLRGVRRQIAERVALAKERIPHYTYVEEIDMTAVEEARRALADSTGQERISPLAFIAGAAVRVLPRYPQLNACLDEQTGEIIYKKKIHLGIAVATEEGLVVPVIRDAGGRDSVELAALIRGLAARARAKKLEPAQLRGSTFTITSLGKLGGVMATPIINYPASAIMGVHAIRTLPRYAGDRLEPRKIMNLSLSLDHRIADGFEAAQFVQEVKEILERADFPELREERRDGRSDH